MFAGACLNSALKLLVSVVYALCFLLVSPRFRLMYFRTPPKFWFFYFFLTNDENGNTLTISLHWAYRFVILIFFCLCNTNNGAARETVGYNRHMLWDSHDINRTSRYPRGNRLGGGNTYVHQQYSSYLIGWCPINYTLFSMKSVSIQSSQHEVYIVDRQNIE